MNIWKNVAYLYGFVIFLTCFEDNIRIAHKKITPNLRKRIAHCMFFSTFFVILKTPFYIAQTFFHITGSTAFLFTRRWVQCYNSFHKYGYIRRRSSIMNLMNQDNIVHEILNHIGDIVIANLLFVFCSIPLVTIGPSLTALYHCTLRSVKGNSYGLV